MAAKRRDSVRIHGGGTNVALVSIAAAMLTVGAGCQSASGPSGAGEGSATQASTAPAHKPFIALPAWLGGSGSANVAASEKSEGVEASATPAAFVSGPTTAPTTASTTGPATIPAMALEPRMTTMPTTTATTSFVEQPSVAGTAVTTMPTTVSTTPSALPTTAMSVAAPMTTTMPTTTPTTMATTAEAAPTTRPVASSAMPAASAPPPAPRAVAMGVDPNAGVVAHKPFIAISRWFGRVPSKGAQPSVLLMQHARSDSPIPLSDYGRQPTHDLKSFGLRETLSAAELGRRLGPPAQLADYASPWYVYRLKGGKELWLHFAQPDEHTLLAADVVGVGEDGYTRNRVFSVTFLP